MFIEVTKIDDNKKILLNITDIARVDNDNNDSFMPCTLVYHNNDVLMIKENYQYIKDSIKQAIDKVKN